MLTKVQGGELSVLLKSKKTKKEGPAPESVDNFGAYIAFRAKTGLLTPSVDATELLGWY